MQPYENLESCQKSNDTFLNPLTVHDETQLIVSPVAVSMFKVPFIPNRHFVTFSHVKSNESKIDYVKAK